MLEESKGKDIAYCVWSFFGLLSFYRNRLTVYLQNFVTSNLLVHILDRAYELPFVSKLTITPSVRAKCWRKQKHSASACGRHHQAADMLNAACVYVAQPPLTYFWLLHQSCQSSYKWRRSVYRRIVGFSLFSQQQNKLYIPSSCFTTCVSYSFCVSPQQMWFEKKKTCSEFFIAWKRALGHAGRWCTAGGPAEEFV